MNRSDFGFAFGLSLVTACGGHSTGVSTRATTAEPSVVQAARVSAPALVSAPTSASSEPTVAPSVDDVALREAESRIGGGWSLVEFQPRRGPRAIGLFARDAGSVRYAGRVDGDDCEHRPCAPPRGVDEGLLPTAQLPLDARLRSSAAYAHALLSLESSLDLPDAPDSDVASLLDALPVEAIRDPAHHLDLFAPHLDALRAYHPTAGCSMDSWPQTVDLLRASAAAGAGHAGWAVQGWLEAVSYWTSVRPAWSTYGANHPEGHLALLEAVHVDAEMLFVGVVTDATGIVPPLSLADAQRLMPDFDPRFRERVRQLARDRSVDDWNRLRFFVIVASAPWDQDEDYAALPPIAKSVLAVWSR